MTKVKTERTGCSLLIERRTQRHADRVRSSVAGASDTMGLSRPAGDPCDETPKSGRQTAKKKASAQDLFKQMGGSETILLAEDEEDVREVTKTILEEFGYHVYTAKNGQEALRVWKTNKGHIDLLLTDVIMPEMGGKELASELLAINKNLKVLFFSGYAENAVVHYGISLESLNFIPKPFTTMQLIEKIKKIMKA